MHLDTTRLLALYGALVSTFAVAINAYREFRDRPRLKLTAMLGYKVNHGATIVSREYMLKLQPSLVNDTSPSFFLTITNTGRRPVLVEGWAIRADRKKLDMTIFCTSQLRFQNCSTEGEYAIERTDDTQLLANGAKSIYAWDTAGKHWSLPLRQFRRLKKEAQGLNEDQLP
jgi:hypothetical protein